MNITSVAVKQKILMDRIKRDIFKTLKMKGINFSEIKVDFKQEDAFVKVSVSLDE